MKNTKREDELIAQVLALTENSKEQHRMQKKMPGLSFTGEMTIAGYGDSLRHFGLNECMVEMLLYSRKEIDALKTNFFRIVIHPEDLHFISDSVSFMNKNPRGSVFSAMIRFVTKENKIIWVNINITRVSQHYDGSTLQFLCNGSIIKQSKQNDLQLELLQKDNEQCKNLRSMPRITITQKKVIKLLVNGNSIEQAAVILSIKPATVIVHLRNIYKRMEIHNIASMCYMAVKYGLN